jgi:hypothetical protein
MTAPRVGCMQGLMAALHKGDDGLAGVGLQGAGRTTSGRGRLGAMPQPVDGCHERERSREPDDVAVA